MAKAVKPKVNKGEIGNSGVSLVSGIIVNEEYNATLVGLRGLRIYDEMRRSDATVRMTLQAMNNPVISADWSVEAASEDARDVEIADMVRTNIIEIIKLRRKLESILTMLPFGFSLFEMVFGPMEINGKLRIGLQDLAFRKQTTITSWETRDHQPGVTQQTIKGIFDIPMENLVRFTHQQEGDNYEGISVLRSAYKHWYIKNKLYQIAAIGHERQAIGVPYAAYDTTATKEQKRDIEKYLKNLRGNEKAFMMFPKGTEVGFMDMKAGSTSNVKPDIEHHDRQISKNSLLQFIEIGASGSSGTRSTSEDHSRMFVLAEEALADTIAETFNDVIIKTLVDLNFSNVEKYPPLRHGKLSDENIPVLSEAVAKLVTADALKLDAADENVFRRVLGLPELTEDQLKKRDEEAKEAKERLKLTPAKDDDGEQDDDMEDEKLMANARRLHASLTKRAYGHTGQAT